MPEIFFVGTKNATLVMALKNISRCLYSKGYKKEEVVRCVESYINVL